MATRAERKILDYLISKGDSIFVASWIEDINAKAINFDMADLIRWANNEDNSLNEFAKRIISNFEVLIPLELGNYIEFDFSASQAVYPGFIKRIA